ncbi:MAG TPA: amidohydrolase family protein [Tepidisphaeraceae bacterium]|jgi:predicted TIM-barrel fold metal-dependent hydrolase|nr:amidohydrolase family protein [Tepidisphaeraceae bacterium]
MCERVTRRDVLGAAVAGVAGLVFAAKPQAADGARTQATAASAPSTQAASKPALPPWTEPIIDIHQHTNYRGRSNEALLHHQKRMGITKTVLLPSGSNANTQSTLLGKANGLYAGAGPIDTVVPIAEAHPHEYYFMANEVPDLPHARETIESWLKKGAVGIGESKFNLPCDSQEMQVLYQLAADYQVPILMHFQYETFNTGFENLEKMLKKYPKTQFIGHAQMMWANIDKNPQNVKINYPKGKVERGGLTDKYLSDYPNFHSDLSAGSGLNAMIRDEDHARWFIERHQDQLVYGSDCEDVVGISPRCTGANMISCVRRLSPSHEVIQKLLYKNAEKLLKLT